MEDIGMFDKYLVGYGEANVYQDMAIRSRSNQTDDVRQMCCLGLAGEVGEIVDHFKKHLYHGHPLDSKHVMEELGDVLWYVATLADAMGFLLSDVMQTNVAKLNARYPNGFTVEDSINRDAKQT